jgi:hypothetical protein
MKFMVVQVSGKQGAGKDATAESVRKVLEAHGIGVSRHSYAKVLYDMQDVVLSIMSRYEVVNKKEGGLLQKIGEWGRARFGEDVWLNIVRKDISHINEVLVSVKKYDVRVPGAHVHIISDCRFPNELKGHHGNMVYRLECPEEIRKARILATPGQNWRENTKAESEIALDGTPYSEFRLVLDSSVHSVEEITKAIVGDIHYCLANEINVY